MFKLVLMTFFLFLMSTFANADSGWTDYGYIAELSPDSQFRYRLVLDISKNPSGCRNDQGFYQDYLSPGSDLMYTTMLHAVIHRLPVRAYVNGKCDLLGNAEITAVSTRPK